LTGGGRKGFSSASIFFDFGTIMVKIPASQTNVSGDDSGFGQLTRTERKRGNYALVRQEKYFMVRQHSKQMGERRENDSFEQTDTRWV
jgi:hypothetical protein